MRIVIVAHTIGDSYGQERVMREMSDRLTRLGHQVSFIAAQQTGELPECENSLVIRGLDDLNFLSSPRRMRGVVRKVLSFCSEFKPDVVHLVDLFDFRIVRKLTASYPVVLSSHTVATTCPASGRLIFKKDTSQVCPKTSGLSCMKHQKEYKCLFYLKSDLHRLHAILDYLLRRRSLKRVKRVIGVSEFMTQTLLKDGWDPAQVRTLYNPVPIPPSIKNVEAPKPLILSVSRLVPLKGIGFLLRAVKRIEDIPWTLWICGKGIEEEELREIAGKLNIANRVRFLGATPYGYTQELMKAATLVAQANIGCESFGLSVAEATALGTPVVASDVPALNEIIVDGQNGLLAPPRDEAKFADNIKRLLLDGSLREQLSQNGPKLARERFSPERHLQELLSIYEECVTA